LCDCIANYAQILIIMIVEVFSSLLHNKMQHTPYQTKCQYDIKGELQELKYEPTVADIKLRFEEMVESLHISIDWLTGANHDAEIIAKLTIAKVWSWYEATTWLWIDGNKHEIVARVSSDNIITLIASLKKSLTNEMDHKKGH